MLPFLIFLAGLVCVVGAILLFRMPAFLALLLGAVLVALITPDALVVQYGLAQGMSDAEAARLAATGVGARIAAGFGRTTGSIGIVIALAAVIGVGMLRSGAAGRIVRSLLTLFGEKRAPEALLGGGFLLAIPVFFDTVFFLMIPLARSLYRQTGRNYLLYVLAIVAGGVMAHSLVPPTPGPLFIADAFGVDLSLMIVGGGMVGLLCAAAGFAYARHADALRPFTPTDLETDTAPLETRMPSLGLALLPIALPLVLITAGAIHEAPWLAFLADKNIALLAGALVALGLLARFDSWNDAMAAVKPALLSAGGIILITGAGGALGQLFQQTNISAAIAEHTPTSQQWLLPVAFLLTMLIRTAQGSATVAMITAAGVFGGMAGDGSLAFHPLYLALAIGCGSKPIWWMNDSGFWVVAQMGGLPEREALRTLTPISVVMGFVGLAITMLGAWLLPLD
ncbi:MAG: SLC13 family permease [Rhodothermales bacterium]